MFPSTKNINNKLLRTFSPNKGNNMNEISNNAPVGEATILDVKHFYIDADGNRVEIPFVTDEDGVTYASDGEAASEETTVYVAADGEDHAVTVH